MHYSRVKLDESTIQRFERCLAEFRRKYGELEGGLREFEETVLAQALPVPLSANSYDTFLEHVQSQGGEGTSWLITFVLLMDVVRHEEISKRLTDEELETFSQWRRRYGPTLNMAWSLRIAPTRLSTIVYDFNSSQPTLKIVRADGNYLVVAADQATIVGLMEMATDLLIEYRQRKPDELDEMDKDSLRYVQTVVTDVLRGTSK